MDLFSSDDKTQPTEQLGPKVPKGTRSRDSLVSFESPVPTGQSPYVDDEDDMLDFEEVIENSPLVRSRRSD